MTMIGFPPALDDRWSLANWQSAPHNRWAFAAMSMYEALLPKARLLDARGEARGKELATILAAMRVGCPF